MKKKIMTLCLCVCMLAIAIVGGTMAYFTDKDAQTNTFTVGDVKIDLTEVAAVYDKDGNELVGRTVQTEDGAVYSNLMPTNVIKKTPTVTNTGNNSAYVRVAVFVNNYQKIHNAIDKVYEETQGDDVYQAKYDEVFDGWGIAVSQAKRIATGPKDMAGRILASDSALTGTGEVLYIDSANRNMNLTGVFSHQNWFTSDAEKEVIANNTKKYVLENGKSYADGYYTKILNQEERIYVYYFKLDAGESMTLFNGLKVPADFDNNAVGSDGTAINQMEMFEGLQIDIKADAIQVEGFDSPEAAFEALEAAHPLTR